VLWVETNHSAMPKKVFLAVDLGAGSGRVLAGKTDFENLYLEELHRFDNPGTDLPGGSFWNVLGLFREIVEGIRLGVEKYGDRVVAVGIDTWGCDHALLDGHGRLLGLPHQYRDPRSQGMAAEAERRCGQQKIYAATGIMPAFYNTSEHLLAEVVRGGAALAAAERLLFIPDLLSYWLSGVAANERTISSTSQLFDPTTNDWAWQVIESLGLPRKLFGRVVEPGTVLGRLRPELARLVGKDDISVVASASHDTASAVAGIPATEPGHLWVSSGTWSIMGVELSSPVLTEDARLAGFGNELGVAGTVRFLKNISGLWIIQECRRHWALQGDDLDYAALAALAEESEPFQAFIDPDDPSFASPGDMPEKIREFCRRTGQRVPEKRGTMLRVATESLALKYRHVYEKVKQLTGREFARLHMGGGGIRNTLLTQATADALGIEVLAGPAEATSCGNLITQMVATAALPDIAAGRELIRRSVEIGLVRPRDPAAWSAAYADFKRFLPA
jgi:rhamnulokinase